MNDKLNTYRRAFERLTKYLTEENPGYEFRVLESTYAGKPDVYLQVRTPKSQKNKDGGWLIIDRYSRGFESYLEAYESLRKFLCRNMPIEFDDYSEEQFEEDDSIFCMRKRSRIEKFIRFPNYDSIEEFIIKMGLRGVDLT